MKTKIVKNVCLIINSQFFGILISGLICTQIQQNGVIIKAHFVGKKNKHIHRYLEKNIVLFFVFYRTSLHCGPHGCLGERCQKKSGWRILTYKTQCQDQIWYIPVMCLHISRVFKGVSCCLRQHLFWGFKILSDFHQTYGLGLHKNGAAAANTYGCSNQFR